MNLVASPLMPSCKLRSAVASGGAGLKEPKHLSNPCWSAISTSSMVQASRIGQACDAVARVGHADGNDRGEMLQVSAQRLIENAVNDTPAPQTHAMAAILGPHVPCPCPAGAPSADAILSRLAPHIERTPRPNDPLL